MFEEKKKQRQWNQILTVINVIPLIDLDINSTIFCFSCMIISVVSDAQGVKAPDD